VIRTVQKRPRPGSGIDIADKGTDFASESSVVGFIEDAYEVITDYEIPGFEDFTFASFVLRSVTSIFNVGNAHLAGLLIDFEKAFDQYARGQDPSEFVCQARYRTKTE